MLTAKQDANAVELALLLDGQKFPPMIPRPLRVARAKAPHKTALAMERAKNGKVRDDKTNGRSKKILDSSHSRIDKLVGQETAARERRRELGVGEFRSSRHSANKDGHVDKQQGKPKGTFRTPETIVFEGRRASEKDGRPAGLVKTKGKGGKSRAARKGGPASKAGGVTKSRGARRAAEWRKVKGSARA